jgi:cell division protein FtsI (penicillin-binding protein 3)
MDNKREIIFRIYLIFIGVVIFSMIVFGRVIYIQTVQKDKLDTSYYIKEKVIPAPRGSIYADDGSPLATSVLKYRFGFDPRVAVKHLPKNTKNYRLFRDSVRVFCKGLARIFPEGPSADEYLETLTEAVEHNRSEMLRTKIAKERKLKTYISMHSGLIDYAAYERIKKLPLANEKGSKSGLLLNDTLIRFYPFGNLAHRTIGFAQEQATKAKTKSYQWRGLEASFMKDLAGTDGKGLFERIAGGSYRPVDDLEAARPVPGRDIHTTLNIGIQDVAESSLRRKMSEFQAKKGCVIVMEVATGHIKAIANLSLQKDGSLAETDNHAITGLMYPGSTFKAASMLAMLEDGLDPESKVDAGDGTPYMFKKTPFRDAKDVGGHGVVSAREAFYMSSNIGIVKLMHKQFGDDKYAFDKYLKKYRLHEPLNFQMVSDFDKPDFRKPEQWQGAAAMYQLSIGYEARFTPIQILSFYNAIANDGKWIQPIIVKEIREGGNVAQDCILTQDRDESAFCDSKALTELRRMMGSVVSESHGTAHVIANDFYTVAGKTGTAQREDFTKDNFLYTTFAGFFPAESPKYSCLVMLYDPRSAETGGRALYAGKASGPVFKDIADKIYSTDISLHPQKQKQVNQLLPLNKVVAHTQDLKAIYEGLGLEHSLEEDQKTWKAISIRDDSTRRLDWKNRRFKENEVPEVRGMTLRDALYVLGKMGYRTTYAGRGKVKQQSLGAGLNVVSNKKIHLTLG